MVSGDDEITLVALGGDGTVHEVINGIKDFTKVRFGVIPTGSGNDFARGLGIKGSVKASVERIIRVDKTKTIDLGFVSYDGCENQRNIEISS